MCAQCLALLAAAVGYRSIGYVSGRGGVPLPMGDILFTLDQARAAVDAGEVLTHSLEGLVPLYAVTTIRGTAVCAVHCTVVGKESGRGYPFAL